MKRSDFEIEVCAGNIQSVIAAYKGGANRVELCSSLIEGGVTPSLGTLIAAKESSGIDVFVLIRPRGGHFVYSDDELSIMLKDINIAVSRGADGVVIGSLNRDGAVNVEQCSRMVEAAHGVPVTFHRAFDVCSDPFKALEDIMSLGIQRLLTSGQKSKAIDGVGLIEKLQQKAGGKLKVMAGSGVDESNIKELAKIPLLQSFHASLRNEFDGGEFYSKPDVMMNGLSQLPENVFKASSEERIKTIIKLIESV